jgi:hypothetical protein
MMVNTFFDFFCPFQRVVFHYVAPEDVSLESQSENEFILLSSRRLIRVIAVPAQLRDNQVFFFL